MKFSLFSVTYAGLFYNGKALTVEQQIYKAKELGFDGLAIEAKRPIASPLDLSKADRARIKSVAADEGIELDNDLAPQLRVETRVIDCLDQLGRFWRSGHRKSQW